LIIANRDMKCFNGT